MLVLKQKRRNDARKGKMRKEEYVGRHPFVIRGKVNKEERHEEKLRNCKRKRRSSRKGAGSPKKCQGNSGPGKKKFGQGEKKGKKGERSIKK